MLIKNDLRGNESHGMSNMLRCVLPPAACPAAAALAAQSPSASRLCREYVSAYQRGIQNPTPNFKLERETPGTALIDADGALGIHAAPYAMSVAIEKAKVCGVGSASLGHPQPAIHSFSAIFNRNCRNCPFCSCI